MIPVLKPLLLLALATPAFACELIPARCDRFADAFAAVAAEHEIPSELLIALAVVESACVPSALSGAGAEGLMQIMPETFRRIAPHVGVDDPWDPTQSIVAGGYYLAALIDFFDGWWVHGLAAYNTGPGRVPHAVPHATWHYVARVIELYECQGGTVHAQRPIASGRYVVLENGDIVENGASQ